MAVLSFRRAVALGLLAAVVLAAGALPSLGVFNGKPVSAGDIVARSVAAIRYQGNDGGVHLCTAVLLGPRLALTAAHCTKGDRSAIRVIFKPELVDITEDEARSVKAVAKAEPSPAGKGMFAYQNPDDVALLLLDAAAPTGTAFATLADALPDGGAVHIAGYGAASDLRKPNAAGQRQIGFDRLLRTATTTLSAKDDAMLVADQTRGSGMCTGDSGGPVFLLSAGRLSVAGTMIGVAAPRSSNDYCRGTAYFASVPRLKPWIVAAAKTLGQPL